MTSLKEVKELGCVSRKRAAKPSAISWSDAIFEWGDGELYFVSPPLSLSPTEKNGFYPPTHTPSLSLSLSSLSLSLSLSRCLCVFLSLERLPPVSISFYHSLRRGERVEYENDKRAHAVLCCTCLFFKTHFLSHRTGFWTFGGAGGSPGANYRSLARTPTLMGDK